jgi:transposase
MVRDPRRRREVVAAERARVVGAREAPLGARQPYRKTQINDRQREAARLHKILEDTGIKLGCVASDIMGKSGRDMLDALVQGTTDPAVLADLARGQLRTKIPALREALEGRFDTEHALIVGQILAHMDFLAEAIDRLSHAIEEQIAPFARQRDLLMTIPASSSAPPRCSSRRPAST